MRLKERDPNSEHYAPTITWAGVFIGVVLATALVFWLWPAMAGWDMTVRILTAGLIAAMALGGMVVLFAIYGGVAQAFMDYFWPNRRRR
jgi:sterol desaturase/sphingolipid hydroxylase (fatty acid hydroxylase superfamily)